MNLDSHTARRRYFLPFQNAAAARNVFITEKVT